MMISILIYEFCINLHTKGSAGSRERGRVEVLTPSIIYLDTLLTRYFQIKIVKVYFTHLHLRGYTIAI